jgi:hypothetical protein
MRGPVDRARASSGALGRARLRVAPRTGATLVGGGEEALVKPWHGVKSSNLDTAQRWRCPLASQAGPDLTLALSGRGGGRGGRGGTGLGRFRT